VNIFLFVTIVVTILTTFVIIYSYTLQFFSLSKKGREWRERIQQDALVGLAMIFLTMLSGFLWTIYFYLILFN